MVTGYRRHDEEEPGTNSELNESQEIDSTEVDGSENLEEDQISEVAEGNSAVEDADNLKDSLDAAIENAVILPEGQNTSPDRKTEAEGQSEEAEGQSEEAEGQEELGEPEELEEPELTEEQYHKLSVRKRIEYRLLHGATKDELLEEGFVIGSIKTVASEMKAAGKITGLPKFSPSDSAKANRSTSASSLVKAQRGAVMSLNKGMLPEAIIESMHMPDFIRETVRGEGFEQGMKFGLSTAVLGIRMAQELAGIGVAQAKPIIDMAKSMREGEVTAAKLAAADASEKVATQLIRTLGPELEGTRNAAEAAAQAADRAGKAAGKLTPTTKNPMQAILLKRMDPLIDNMFSGMIGMLGKMNPALGASTAATQLPAAGEGTPDEEQIVPVGWQRKSE